MRRPPIVTIKHEGYYPEDRRRCVLTQDGDEVFARINTAHGQAAFNHAAYHGEAGVPGLGFTCRTDRPCGYRDGADGRDGDGRDGLAIRC